jgi:hypothetical protein
MVSIATYHQATPDYHQQQFDSPDGLANKGYRIISLGVYRQGNNVRYAAVWSDKGGPSWKAFHGRSPDEYQTIYNNWTSEGYRPVIVTATGGGTVGLDQTNSSIFAGVFEKDPNQYVAKHGIDFKTFKDTCEWAKKNSHILRWAAIYGGKNRFYAGIWDKVGSNVQWDYKITIAIDGPELGVPVQSPDNPSLYLSFVTRSPFAEYLAVYRSDQFHNIKERHAMTSNDFQIQHDQLKAQGYYPFCVQAGGDPRVSDIPKFVGVFQKL